MKVSIFIFLIALVVVATNAAPIEGQVENDIDDPNDGGFGEYPFNRVGTCAQLHFR